MLQTIFDNAEAKLNESVEFLQKQLVQIRAGQATPALVQDIVVDAYGTKLTIKELGAISAPQANLLVISCWDDTVVEAIAKAIQQSNLGINPVIDGKTIKVPVPSLTEERRQAMIKEVGEQCEATRVDIRQVRHEKIKSVDELKDEKKISEDEHENAKEYIQELVDEANKKVEEIKTAKVTALNN